MEIFGKDQIDDYLKGFVSYNEDVALFEFGDVVVLKKFKEKEQVRIISGGSASHIEFVGNGMLTASVQGKRGESPNTGVILRTIRELGLNHVRGVLIIIQANSSDLLNFGLATERADNDDLKVALLKVSDDCKNEQYSKSNKRGLSGVILVNKIAGALADMHKTLSEIHDYCSKVCDNILSTGINIKKLLLRSKECVYCEKCSMDIEDNKALKKTILKKTTVEDILNEIVQALFVELISDEKFARNKENETFVVLVNNFGALNQIEQYIFYKNSINFFNHINVKIMRFYMGTYLYLKCDYDITVTILKVFDNKDLLNLLDMPCTSVKGWKSTFQMGPLKLEEDNLFMQNNLKRKCRLSAPVKGPKLTDRAANIVQICLQFACDALISCEKMLNKMDSEKGDGDTGTRLRIMAELLNKRSCNKKLNIHYPFTFFLTLSKLLENTIGGSMGCLYSIIFESAAKTFGTYKEWDEINAEMWLKALENSCKAIKKYGNVTNGDKTMLDPLETCAINLKENFPDGRYIFAFNNAVARAEEIAQATKKPENKYPDSGAHAVGIWLRAVCEAVKLRVME